MHGVAEVEQERIEEALRFELRQHHRRALEADHGAREHRAHQSRQVLSLGERMEGIAIAVYDVPGFLHFSLESRIIGR
jgi:hypothetical protein